MTIELRGPAPMLANEIKKFPYVAACDVPACYFVVSARDITQAQESLDVHKCPSGGPSEKTKRGMQNNVELWRQLDSCVDALMLAKAGNPPIQSKVDYFKGKASGLATAMFILWGGPPGYYETQDDITREAMRRYKMRIGELEWEPTQCDNYDALRDGPTPRWAPVVMRIRQAGARAQAELKSPVARVTRGEPRPSRRASSAPTATPLMAGPSVPILGLSLPGAPRKLPDDVVTGIRNALAAQMDMQTIMSIFRVTKADVDALGK